MPTTAAQNPFLLYICDGCAVDGRQIRVDDARLRMGLIAQRFAKQSFGCIGIGQRRNQEINGGTGRIDGPIQVAPAALHSNVGLVHAPGFVGRLVARARLAALRSLAAIASIASTSGRRRE